MDCTLLVECRLLWWWWVLGFYKSGGFLDQLKRWVYSVVSMYLIYKLCSTHLWFHAVENWFWLVKRCTTPFRSGTNQQNLNKRWRNWYSELALWDLVIPVLVKCYRDGSWVLCWASDGVQYRTDPTVCRLNETNWHCWGDGLCVERWICRP